jgi:chromosome segregation ATPase
MSPAASSPSLTKSTKSALQDVLKDKHKINKDISQNLTAEECRQLVELLSNGNTGLEKLLTAYAGKTSDLRGNNISLGKLRASAENKAEKLQREYQELQNRIKAIEDNNVVPGGRKKLLENEAKELEQQIGKLQAENQLLTTTVKKFDADKILLTEDNHELKKDNRELTEANHELKKDNKRLKNLVDAIRLHLSRDVKDMLGKKDGELRKALAKSYKSILG